MLFRSQAASSREEQAQSGRLPKVNYTESWQRSNNPVFVFGALLTQRQFSESNFAIGSLNNPAALNNFQSVFSVDQPLYDAGQTKQAEINAKLGIKLAAQDKRKAEQQLIGRVASAYYGVLLATAMGAVADSAVRSAEADLQRAESVRDAGMATDADVLAIKVHLAAMREERLLLNCVAASSVAPASVLANAGRSRSRRQPSFPRASCRKCMCPTPASPALEIGRAHV